MRLLGFSLTKFLPPLAFVVVGSVRSGKEIDDDSVPGEFRAPRSSLLGVSISGM